VVKNEVIRFISAPRNKFYLAMSQLSRFENHQEYLHGFDLEEDEKELSEHKEALYEKVEKVLPFLSHKRRKVLQLCLDHEFSYMKISKLTGMKHSRVVHEVKQSIADLRTIVHGQEMKGFGKERKNKRTISFSRELSPSQTEILRMRSKEGASFDAIAQKMDVPKSEVHKQFVIAYRLLSKMHHKEFKKSA
jgi:DNA-directed RNA polymerase specialized sigma24 family protein